jgi:hypothetical protein
VGARAAGIKLLLHQELLVVVAAEEAVTRQVFLVGTEFTQLAVGLLLATMQVAAAPLAHIQAEVETQQVLAVAVVQAI